MTKYFEAFNRIIYNDANAINIMQRTAIMNSVFGNRYAFYPYHVKNGMRAEQVAERYYGSTDYVWLVYMSNNIVDPYHDWTKDDETFRRFIIEKYGSLETARSSIVSYRVNWYDDPTKLSKEQYEVLPSYLRKYWEPVFDNNNLPLHYERKKMDHISVSMDGNGSVSLPVPLEEQQYWTAVSAYDVEEEINADKAHIRLLDNKLAQAAASNLKELLRD